jgi:agmatine deiminase
MKTPAALGYRMPAEWEPHEATWLTWPHDERHFPRRFAPIPGVWARIVKELEVGEDVHIFIHDDETQLTAILAMREAGVVGTRVHLHRAPNNFSWARDHGPIFVKNPAGDRLILDWKYNAWGRQWEYDLDDELPKEAAKITGIPFRDIDMVLEGGSIDVNGKGTLLTTENCLLNPNRNPDLTKAQIEQYLKDCLGVTNILWLGEGIMGDDTSGHVDDLTRFVGPRTVVTIIAGDPSDPDYIPLQENLNRLHSMTDQDGEPLDIRVIEQPKPVLIHEKASKAKENAKEGFRIPASYANFYIGNEAVLLPVFGDPNDQKAVDVLQKCFPDRRIVPIDSKDLTWGFGSFHCVTQQMPA